MYHSKKIGVFISHIFGYYQKNVCQGIIDKASEYGYTAEIYTSMDGENLGDYGAGEDNILHILNYDALDGIIFASGTYISQEFKTKILDDIKKNCSCPVIEITEYNPSFPSVRLDNNSTTAQLTEHMILEHGAKRICYLGCKGEAFFSDQREHFYRTTMEKYNRTIAESDVYNATYSDESVTEALDFFEQGGHPNAVICYNDRLALLLMAAALRQGYKLPQDMAITGCDDLEDGQNTTPSLTTVSFPIYELGTRAVELLIKRFHGEAIPDITVMEARPIYRSSCGCNSKQGKSSVFYQQALQHNIAALEASIIDSMNMSASFQGIADLDDGMDMLVNYIEKIAHCREFYLCLYSNWDTVSDKILKLTASEESADLSDSNNIILKLAWKNGKRLPECSFVKNSPLPEHIYNSTDHAYIFTPLFFGQNKFGYVALAYENNLIDYHFQIVHWIMNISHLLQTICDAKRTGMLIQRLENIYTRDALTGLYNKHGYLAKEPLLLADAVALHENLTCFFFDLDCLKQINDHFGHNEGDFAIQVIGHAIESTAMENDICARFSGDEFYVLTRNYTESEAKDFILSVNKYIENYNKLSSKPYLISVSGGFASTIPDASFGQKQVSELFDAADKNMFDQKMHKDKKFRR